MVVHPSTRMLIHVAILAFVWSFTLAIAQESLAPVPIPFTATLSGDQVVEPVDSPGHGEVVAVLIGNELVVTGTYQDLSSPLRPGREAYVLHGATGEDGDHIRMSAEQATLGPPRFAQLSTSGATSGYFTGVFTLTEEQVEQLKRGLYHVQLDTEQNSSGEIRGQLGSELVLDLTAEDMVGIWWNEEEGDGVQYYTDGTWDYMDSLADAGEAAGPFNQWTFEDGIFTRIYGSSQQVEYTELYRDGRRRYLVLDAGFGGDIVGTWHERVRIDAGGNRVDLR